MFGNEREIRRHADICDIKELKPFNEKLVY